MKNAVFEFQLLTPAILAGADQTTAEMRIPSIRGALRWWTRLLAGEETERDIFGYVQGRNCQPSKVVLRLLKSVNNRVLPDQNTVAITRNKFDYFLWPLNTNLRGVIQPGAKYTVAVQVKPGYENADSLEWLEPVIKAFLLFGSLGTRSRRAYGSVWPVSAKFDGEDWDIPQNIDDLLDESDDFFADANISIYTLADACQNYPDAVKICADFLKTIRCGKSEYGSTASKWGKNDHEAGLQKSNKIYRAALGLPLAQKYSSTGKKVEYSVNGWDRMASPLHFKVIKLEGKFIPVLLVIPEYTPQDGTKVKAQIKAGGSGSFYLQLDRALLDKLRNNAESLFDGMIQQAYYPCDDE